ncbi:MAG: hypothetical protein CL510_03405 [Actinobacteria bacterium]|nr:hypothetical protein [Actinomycetota bacterium]|tara:strand:+ start:434 stop:808 length:375 start_codon:yes stop_codon:yes gene_type:complete
MGSTTHQSHSRTFQATGVAIAAYAVVAVDSSGTISVAGDNATDIAIGVTLEDIAASGYGAVQLFNAGGTAECLCGGNTIAVGDAVYTDGSGKVGTDTSNTKIGYALAASSTDGDVIEVVVASVI